MSSYGNPMFTTVQLPQSRGRWGSFVVGYAVQASALVALVVCTVTVPAVVRKASTNIDLVAPTPVSTRPAAARTRVTPAPKIAPARMTAPQLKAEVAPVLQVQQPQRIHRTPEIAEVAQPQLPVARFDSKALPTVPAPKIAPKIIATNTFGGSSAAPTLPKTIAVSKVQTGGFGDPNGAAASTRGSNQAALAPAGGFDLPQGGGNGNGRGGSSGIRGTVSSTGFGSSEAVQASNRPQARIQSTSFNSQPAPATESRQRANQQASTPVLIQSKPTPVYTQEARQLRVEGEVLLNVVFTASGQIRIVSVVRGLGHGLDESAQRAAQGVKFSPAMRDGHPVDSSAVLHIVFQLS